MATPTSAYKGDASPGRAQHRHGCPRRLVAAGEATAGLRQGKQPVAAGEATVCVQAQPCDSCAAREHTFELPAVTGPIGTSAFALQHVAVPPVLLQGQLAVQCQERAAGAHDGGHPRDAGRGRAHRGAVRQRQERRAHRGRDGGRDHGAHLLLRGAGRAPDRERPERAHHAARRRHLQVHRQGQGQGEPALLLPRDHVRHVCRARVQAERDVEEDARLCDEDQVRTVHSNHAFLYTFAPLEPRRRNCVKMVPTPGQRCLFL